jgi:tRNA A37 threonylcarbamoyladenosine dehydratase
MIELEQFMRTKILLGEEKIEQLANSHIIVAGVGGVGGYVVEALVRAGIGNLTIIDHDVVDITNLNRQLITNLDNLGQAKVAQFRQRIKQINPQINLVTQQTFIDANNLPQLLASKPNYVIDCIDTIESKLSLITYCLTHKIKLISSMGAGNRIDVTKVKFADISKTKECALARNLRLRLRKLGIHKGLTVIYSEEQSFAKPMLNPQGGRPINGTISYLPALFGIMLAGKVLQELIYDEKL